MTEAKSKRQRKPKEGDVLAIPLGDGTFGFCQVCVGGGSYAYFDLRSESPLPPETIVASPIAFRVCTAGGAAKEGNWAILGNSSLLGSLAEEAAYRNQPVGSNQLNLVKGNQVIPASYEEVKNFELMACWFAHHIVERLNDHFAGRPNAMAEGFKKIKVYDPKTGQELNPETGEMIKGGPPKSETVAGDSQALPSKGQKPKKPASVATLEKLNELAGYYDQLVASLRAADDERLTLYANTVEGGVTQLKAMIAAGVDAQTGREMIQGIREGLRETPRLLASLVPDRCSQLVSEIERKLGKQLSAV